LSSLIKLKQITKIYQTSDTVLRALDGIDLTIEKQELLAVVGASGSGKSTLMNIIGLLDQPTEGIYTLDGQDVAEFNDNTAAEIRNKKIGFVFQLFYLLPRLTAAQNIALPLLYRGIHPSEAKETIYNTLEKVGIAALVHKRPNQMSGGEQQRVAIARALVGSPDIILADEPTGALDSKTSQEILDLFLDLNKNDNKTIIVITHDPTVSEQCKRVVTLKDGKIIEDRT